MSNGIPQLGGKGGILGNHAQAALPGIDAGKQLVGIGDRLLQILGHRLVFEQRSYRSFAGIDLGGDIVELVPESLSRL